MCACREEKKTSSPGKMHVLRTHFSTSRHTTLRHFHCIKINAEDSLLRFHKVKPVGLSKLPVPLTVAPPGESAIVPGPHYSATYQQRNFIGLSVFGAAQHAGVLARWSFTTNQEHGLKTFTMSLNAIHRSGVKLSYLR